MNAPVAAATRLRQPTAITLARAPEGFDAFVVADLTRTLAPRLRRRWSCRADILASRFRARAEFRRCVWPSPRRRSRRFTCRRGTANPTTGSPLTPQIAAQRMTALARLALTRPLLERPRLLLTTVNALFQSVTPP